VEGLSLFLFLLAHNLLQYATLNEIFGTPLYVINGLKVLGLATFDEVPHSTPTLLSLIHPSFPSSQWQATLDPILSSEKKKSFRSNKQKKF
jgi:hypothetical protein